MMIRISGEYLEFNDLIEVEKQIKLFEEIETTDGDFSYSFEVEKTLVNTRLLGNPRPDNINKPVYQKIYAELISESGAELHRGYLRVEKVLNRTYSLSFFGGNNNWFGMLSGPISDIDLSEFDIDLNQSNIQAAIFNTEGVVFPVVDNGALNIRGSAQLTEQDFLPAIYVKTLFNKIFTHHGIKIQGELLQDVEFLSAITLSTGKTKEDIDSASSYVENSAVQARPSNILYKATFTNDSVYPFYDGSLDAFDLPNNRWVAPFKSEIQLDFSYRYDNGDAAAIVIVQRIRIYINGSFTDIDIGVVAGGLYESTKTYPYVAGEGTHSISRRFFVNEGDVIEIYTQWQKTSGATSPSPLLSSTLKITPVFIYKAFGRSMVPNWTQQQYVSNILRSFNVLSSYNSKNKTLTFNLFEKIKDKPSIDLSEYIESIETDYTEFISNYGKQNRLTYNELEDKELRADRFPYGAGVINVNNDFLEDSVEMLESEFTNPISYINTTFDMSMERTKLLELEEDLSTEATEVTDSSGRPRFAIEKNIFIISDIVRVSNSPQPQYNGDWKIYSIGTGWVELNGVEFLGDSTATIAKLNYRYTESDNVYLLRHIPLYTINKFSGLNSFMLENTELETISFAFFNLLNTGRQVNRDFKYSLSFATHNQIEQYQISMTDQYFRLFTRVLADPVKLFCVAYLPKHVYDQIDFLSPVSIRSEETTNVYYLNRITGYKESYLPCVLELIKLP